MADFGAMRTGHHVVRYRPPWKSRLLFIGGGVGAALLMFGMYELGRYEGGYSKLAEIQRRREQIAQVAALQEANEKLRADVAAVELARSVDRKAYTEVEKNLQDLQAQVLKHREELAFYRGIVSPENGIGGLKVQGFQIAATGADNRFQLRMVLVQSMSQDAVASGSAKIEIEGILSGEPVQLALSEVGGSTRADGLVPFQFRYFQNIEQDISLPADFEPRGVTVEVRLGKQAPVRESYPWQVQVEG